MTLQTDIETLARFPAFAVFEPDALRTIALAGQTRVLRTNDILFHQGDGSEGGFIVLDGMIRLERLPDNHLKVVRAVTLIGETALLTPTTRPATATACEPTSVLCIGRTAYRRTLEQFPVSARRLHATVAAKVAQLHGDCDGLVERLHEPAADPGGHRH